MFAKLSVGAMGLVLALLAALAGAAGVTVVLGQSPTPTPTTTASVPAPTPVVTPVGCLRPTLGSGLPPASTGTGGPAAASGMRAQLVADPQLASGFAVQLTWQDNSSNETCIVVAVLVDRRLVRIIGPWAPWDASTTGPMSFEDIPDQTGLHCYLVDFGNSGGQSYSNEACVEVEVVPVRLEPTPLPPGCQGEGPIGAPGTPNPPANLRAEVVPSSGRAGGLVVRLTWEDNATDDLCYTVEWTGGPERLPYGRYVFGTGRPPAEVGVMTDEETAYPVATYCYRVQFGNEAGRSPYSNEACVDVEALPVWETATPTPAPSPTLPPVVPTWPPVTPSPPPWPCLPDVDPPYSELGPSAPTNRTAVLVADAAIPGRYVVRLAWQDNAEGESCYKVQKRDQAGTWRTFTASGGSMTTALDGQPDGDAPCYRVWAANENGRSDYSNEACATGPAVAVTPTPVVTPTPAATRAVVVVPSGLPATGGGAGGVGPAWRWWALAAASTALLGMAALSLARATRRRHPPSR